MGNGTGVSTGTGGLRPVEHVDMSISLSPRSHSPNLSQNRNQSPNQKMRKGSELKEFLFPSSPLTPLPTNTTTTIRRKYSFTGKKLEKKSGIEIQDPDGTDFNGIVAKLTI